MRVVATYKNNGTLYTNTYSLHDMTLGRGDTTTKEKRPSKQSKEPFQSQMRNPTNNDGVVIN
jgi:hypothetical protein